MVSSVAVCRAYGEQTEQWLDLRRQHPSPWRNEVDTSPKSVWSRTRAALTPRWTRMLQRAQEAVWRRLFDSRAQLLCPSIIGSLEPWEQQLFKDWRELTTEPALFSIMQNEKEFTQLYIGSDGGMLPQGEFKNRGSQGWVIATSDKILWRGSGPVVSYPKNASFRTEAFGLLAILRLLYHTANFWGFALPDVSIKSHTDSLSLIQTRKAMEKFQDDWYPVVMTWNHIDVLQQIHLDDEGPLPTQGNVTSCQRPCRRKNVVGHSSQEKNK